MNAAGGVKHEDRRSTPAASHDVSIGTGTRALLTQWRRTIRDQDSALHGLLMELGKPPQKRVERRSSRRKRRPVDAQSTNDATHQQFDAAFEQMAAIAQERAERFLALRDLVQHARQLGAGSGAGDGEAGRRAQLAQLRRAAEFVVLPLSKARAPSCRKRQSKERGEHEQAVAELAAVQHRARGKDQGQSKRRRENSSRPASALSATMLQEAKTQLRSQTRQRGIGEQGEEHEHGVACKDAELRACTLARTPRRRQATAGGGTREVLLRSLAFRRYRICIDDDCTDSPCASPGAFGTPTSSNLTPV